MKVNARYRFTKAMGCLALLLAAMVVLAPSALAQAPAQRRMVGLVSRPTRAVVSVTRPARTGAIVSTVYQDWDQDGELDASEPRLAGATVVLTDGQGFEMGSQETDDQGIARFERLRAGTYVVVERNPLGYTSSTADKVQIEVRPGEAVRVLFGDILVLR